ncbi:MAG: CPBP family intramembrane metalloprotease [Erysipelotrichaceae bacterium]|nr:CPBP family intramembrane metalloprotease [Erysipelotrichaceae bacterium]
MNKKKTVTVVLMAVSALLAMAYVERIMQPGYWIKSLIKLFVFGGSILLYAYLFKENLRELIHLKKIKPSKKLIFFMAFAYVGIIVSYLLLSSYIDLDSIKESLIQKEHLSRKNFLFIFSYIILINSFLEESFFRGFLYQTFKQQGMEKAGILFSALVFALYHISIMDGWFHPAIMLLGIAGLFLVGIFLQIIMIREDSLSGSWLVHAFANLAINTIATIMLLT